MKSYNILYYMLCHAMPFNRISSIWMSYTITPMHRHIVTSLHVTSLSSSVYLFVFYWQCHSMHIEYIVYQIFRMQIQFNKLTIKFLFILLGGYVDGCVDMNWHAFYHLLFSVNSTIQKRHLCWNPKYASKCLLLLQMNPSSIINRHKMTKIGFHILYSK